MDVVIAVMAVALVSEVERQESVISSWKDAADMTKRFGSAV
jgi:hypothetical protein